MPHPLTKQFVAHINAGREGIEKTAAVSEAFTRDKLRENSVFRKIIPPDSVDASELQPSPNHDTLVFLDYIEPNSRAMTLTFRDQPTARYIEGDKYEIPFHRISSERMEKTEEELLAYSYPITKVIENNIVRDIQEIEDHRGITYSEAAVQTTGNIIRGVQALEDEAINGPGNGLRGQVQRSDLIELAKVLNGSRRVCDTFLMAETDANDVMHWTIETWGDEAGKITVGGFTYDKLLGYKVVRTIKQEILQPGNIYAFTEKSMLGKFLILNGTRFFLDKDVNMITFQAYEIIGMSISNIASVAKCELYNGQGGGDDSSDSLVSEREVGGGVYNQVAAGNFFPTFYHY
jgi:hypothetical protein